MRSSFDRQFRALHGAWPDAAGGEPFDGEFVVIEDRSGFARSMGAGGPPGRRDPNAELRKLKRLERLGWGALALAGCITFGALCLMFLALLAVPVGLAWVAATM